MERRVVLSIDDYGLEFPFSSCCVRVFPCYVRSDLDSGMTCGIAYSTVDVFEVKAHTV